MDRLIAKTDKKTENAKSQINKKMLQLRALFKRSPKQRQQC